MSLFALVALMTAASPDAVVARINGEAITAAEVSSRMIPAGRAATLIEAVDELISETTLAEAARRDKIAGDAKFKARVAAERRALAVRRLFEKDVYAKVSVTDAQVKDFFHGRVDQVRLALVVRATKDEAKGVFDRLSAGKSVVEEAKSSIDPRTRESGGDLPWTSRSGLDPALATAAFGASVGKPVGPVALGNAWAVFIVRDRKVGDDAELAKDREMIRAAAELGARDQAAGRFVDELRRTKSAKVNAGFLSSAPATPTQADLKKPVATAGKITVLYSEVLDDAAKSGGGAHGGAVVKEMLAAKILERKLLEQTAAERGYTKDAAVNAEVRRVERALLAQAYREKIRGGVAAPTAAEIEARYRERPKDFQLPARRKCWQVVSKAQAESSTLRARLAKGEAFETVAKESVHQATAQHGGLIGDISDPELEGLEKAGKDAAVAGVIRKLGPGELSNPVQASTGDWHVFRCDAVQPARTLALAEVREQLAHAMKAERGDQALRARVLELRKVAQVKMDDAALAQLKQPRPPHDAMHGR